MTMDRAQRTFIDRMGIAAEADGLSPIAGRLFALLLLADEPRSLDDLAAGLGVSKASVSTDARRLLERGIVERVARTGDRRDFYELTPDFFVRIVESRIARWRRMQALSADVRAESTEMAPVVRQRLASIDAAQSFIIGQLEETIAEWQHRPRAAGTTKRTRAQRASQS
jgi:DNA-binding transcriptional regulator GbsR (MarR family)